MQTNQSAPEDAQILATATAPTIAENPIITENTTTGANSSASPATNGGDASASSAAVNPAPPAPQKAAASNPLVIMKAVAQLRPHDENAKIYGDKESVDDLCKSISRNKTGILEALLITKDGRVISGHRRYRAALKLGLTEVPVRIFESEDEIEILNALLEHNRHRVKSKVQIANEASLRLRIEKERAAQAKTTAKGTGENLPPRKKGKARDAAGKDLGYSGRTVEKAAKTAEAITKLRSEGKEEDAVKLEQAVNKGFDTGFKTGIEMGVIEKPKAPRKPSSTKVSSSEAPAPCALTLNSRAAEEKLSETSEAEAPVATEATPLDGDKALTLAAEAATFLRGCAMLTKEQQRAWGKLIDELNRIRKSFGF